MSKGKEKKEASDNLSVAEVSQRQAEPVAPKDELLADLIECIDEVAAERDAALEERARLSALLELREADLVALEAVEPEIVEVAPDEEVTALKTEIQTLEDYIDGRKADWEGLDIKVVDYRDALAGMQVRLEEKDAEVSEQVAANKELEKAVAELQKECAALDGRRAERELNARELNELLAGRAGELEAKTLELTEARKSVKVAAIRADDQVRHIADLEQANSALELRLANLEGGLEDMARSTAEEVKEARLAATGDASDIRLEREALETEVARCEEALAEANEQITLLKREIGQLKGEIARLGESNLASEDRFEAESHKLGSLGAELQEVTESRDALQKELDAVITSTTAQMVAKTDAIAKLEAQLGAQTDTVALRNTNEGSPQVTGHSVKPLEAGAGYAASRLMVAISGMPNLKFPLYKPMMTIGRSCESDIQVQHQGISRAHAQLIEDRKRTRLEDLGSRNGICVNGERVISHYLRDGDIVSVGDVKFRFVDQEKSKVDVA